MRFPAWLFCPKCRRMDRWDDRREALSPGQIPACKQPGCKRPRTPLVPMRWVAACADGHLEDVNWWRWAHSGPDGRRSPCDPRHPDLSFRSSGSRGASLEALQVKCERCGSARNLREIVGGGALRSIGQRCRGKQPWEDTNEDCEQHLSVLQRSQAGLHLAQVVSALDIRTEQVEPDERQKAIAQALGTMVDGPDEVDEMAEQVATGASRLLRRQDPESQAVKIDEVLRVAASLPEYSHSGQSTEPSRIATDREEQLMSEEWSALTNETTASSGRPPLVVKRAQHGEAGPFSSLMSLFNGIFLVERLREVRVFEGFHRVNDEGKMLYPDLTRTPPRWLPATEVFGEGIFIRFDPDRVRAWEQANRDACRARFDRFKSALDSGGSYTKRYESRRMVHERFVMAHTFAHLLIRQLCYESGYHNASLRERLYVFSDKIGVLIYTADGDSEGSLGGLVRQGEAHRLWPTMVSALERGAWCSNDPVCAELPPHGPARSNLAACHACAMAAETSCTESNGLLDRMTVVGDGVASSVRGYFREALDSVLAHLAQTE
jgi:hypothetical protein